LNLAGEDQNGKEADKVKCSNQDKQRPVAKAMAEQIARNHAKDRSANRPTEADEAYSRAIDSKAGYAQARLNRGLARLLMGEFETGWDDFESRWQTSDFPTGKPKFAQPEWIGDDLRGRALLVYYEQGLGDTIQFSRYLPLLAARGGRVLFVFPRELRALFSGLAGVTLIDPDGPKYRYVDGQLEPLEARAFDLSGSQSRFDLDEIEKLLD